MAGPWVQSVNASFSSGKILTGGELFPHYLPAGSESVWEIRRVEVSKERMGPEQRGSGSLGSAPWKYLLTLMPRELPFCHLPALIWPSVPPEMTFLALSYSLSLLNHVAMCPGQLGIFVLILGSW